MISDIMKSAETRMQKSIEALKNELTKIRTGRAHPSLLDHVSVDYYGTPTALSQVANIAIEDARTLSITPWEKPMVAVIEKAILKSDLGLNPAVAGTVIRVPKTYPAYFGAYSQFPKVREWLDNFDNLFLVGRNGMHRYNNQDHSMLTAKLAVEAILAGRTDKAPIWAVNIDDEYHEEATEA